MSIDHPAMLWRALCVSVLISVAGCTAQTAESCALGPCLTTGLPFCDVDGRLGGSRNECIAVTCSPGEFAICRDDQAITCNATGDNYDLSACEYGCDENIGGCRQCQPNARWCEGDVLRACDTEGRLEAPEACTLGCLAGPIARCRHLEPKYLPDVCDAVGTTNLVTETMVLDTDVDGNCNGGVVDQTAAPSICVLHHETISVPIGTTLRLTGRRAAALVADRSLSVDGVLDAGAAGETSGPGGGFVLSGGSDVLFKGGGGAGFKTAGGAGGTASGDGGAANGGSATTDPALLSALVGGPRTGGAGGGGGITLVSCGGSVSVTGMVAAGGAGGRPGGKDTLMGTSFVFNAFGGGAGGNIVLQGADVIVTGTAFVNGGGGGGGKPIDADQGMPGESGRRSATFAASGGAATPTGGAGAGGRGGIRDQLPDVGRRSTLTNATSGGGGGSVGFLQTYTPVGVTPRITPTEVSPMFQANGTVRTR